MFWSLANHKHPDGVGICVSVPDCRRRATSSIEYSEQIDEAGRDVDGDAVDEGGLGEDEVVELVRGWAAWDVAAFEHPKTRIPIAAIAPRRHQRWWPCRGNAERYRFVFVSRCMVFVLSVAFNGLTSALNLDATQNEQDTSK